MNVKTETPEQYMEKLPEERKNAVGQLRKTILDNLPEGFVETMSYDTIGYVVPHSIYPDGYHCDPKQPLPFIGIASRKNYIALYHSGMYADNELSEWFVKEYPNYCKTKPDMGKGCIRFKNVDRIPYKLVGELSAKMTSEEWIKIYESTIKR